MQQKLTQHCKSTILKKSHVPDTVLVVGYITVSQTSLQPMEFIFQSYATHTAAIGHTRLCAYNGLSLN